MTRQIVMVGTGFGTRGGIAAVVQVYAEQGLLARERVRYIATHGDGSRLRKLLLALRAWLQWMGLLLGGRVALLHVHSASGPSFWRKCGFLLPAFALRVPVVLHWHGGGFVEFFQGSGPRAQAFIRRVFLRCDRVIALSAQWNDMLRQCIPGLQPVTITNPVRLPANAAPLVDTPPVVLFLGLVHEAKGVFDLLEAWPAVLQRHPQARLRLAGAGDLDTAQRRASALGIAASVDWLGWIGPEAKAGELARAWLLTLPSHNEGVPMAVLEAMAAGVPVVASNVGGIPLAVRDGIDGLLRPARDVAALADALDALLGDAPRRLAMGAAARQHAGECFGAEAIVQQISSLWQELAPRPQAVERAV